MGKDLEKNPQNMSLVLLGEKTDRELNYYLIVMTCRMDYS